MWHGFFVSRCVGRWPLTGPCERRALARSAPVLPFPTSLRLSRSLPALVVGMDMVPVANPQVIIPWMPDSADKKQAVLHGQWHALDVISLSCLHKKTSTSSTWCIPDIAVHSECGVRRPDPQSSACQQIVGDLMRYRRCVSGPSEHKKSGYGWI